MAEPSVRPRGDPKRAAPAWRDARGWRVAALALVIYLPGLRNGFVFDDLKAIVQNPLVTGHLSLRGIFTHDFWGGSAAEPGTVMGVYRPLVNLTFALDWHLGGGRPWVFHLTNALLHAAATLGFYRVFCTRLVVPGAALAAGVLFAVHPLHTEAVASVVGRADVMAFLFAVLLRAVHPRAGPRAALAAPLFLLAAAFCKESAALLVPLLAVADLAGARPPWRQAVARYTSYLAVLGCVVAVRLRVVGSLQGYALIPRVNPLVGTAFLTREVTAMRLFARALGLLVAPVDLLPDYGQAVVVPSAHLDARAALGAAAVLALAALAFTARRQDPLRVEAVAWLAAPGLFAVNAVFVFSTVFAERLWYLPSAGACLLAGEAVGWLAGRRRVLTAWLAGVFAALYASITVARTAEWATQESLFAAAVATEPRSAVSQFGLGASRLAHRRPREALVHCAAATRLAPGWEEPRVCSAAAYVQLGRVADAEREYEALRGLPDVSAESLLRYAQFLGWSGRPARALTLLRLIRSWGYVNPEADVLERAITADLQRPPAAAPPAR